MVLAQSADLEQMLVNSSKGKGSTEIKGLGLTGLQKRSRREMWGILFISIQNWLKIFIVLLA